METVRSIKLSFLILIIMTNTIAFGQGGWFIKYIPVDSLNSKLIGKEVRIDFKASQSDSIEVYTENGFDIRNLLIRKEDSIELILSGNSVIFKEIWKLHIDYGSLSEQSLISLKAGEHIQIKEMVIETINELSVVLDVIVYYSEGKKEREKIVIPKYKIKGLLLRTD
jgi:hypothetical protein